MTSTQNNVKSWENMIYSLLIFPGFCLIRYQLPVSFILMRMCPSQTKQGVKINGKSRGKRRKKLEENFIDEMNDRKIAYFYLDCEVLDEVVRLICLPCLAICCPPCPSHCTCFSTTSWRWCFGALIS